ncbi:MAG TPA: TM2 domain-containing protein, partial [Ktedonobacterales bacterium]
MDDIRRQEVRQIAQLTARLDPAQQIFFQAEYSLHRRNPTTAFLLCLLLGDFGAHYFYFGRNRAGVVRLLFCWTLIPAILALFDARTMTARARRYNASLAHELVLAIQGAVEEHATVPDALVEAAPRAPVASGRRPVLAAP